MGVFPALILFLLFIGVNIGPLLLLGLVGFVIYTLMQRQGSLTGPKKRKNSHQAPASNVSFEDIGGQDRAKHELQETIQFLKDDQVASSYGIRPLKGILLTGPPGTGKTMMAKAAANYADAAFVSASGAEFVEMYVGVGASRIRELFEEVKKLTEEKKLSRGIIFIDEIDAIGGKRDGGQQREYDQTLNQLLTEMDGMSTAEYPRILVIAATNRKDMLDDALLRPGRFDRHIAVELPDKKAREHILKLHFRNKPLAVDVQLDDIASDTFGFSGAQLESVANEAAIYAFRQKSKQITRQYVSLAIDKVMMGEETDKESSEAEKKRVAYHELGHAIAAEVLRPESVAEVVLVPRGSALGYVRHVPRQESNLYTRKYIEDQIVISLAGAVAEEIYYGERSTGSKNDFEQAIKYVHYMIDTGLSALGIVSVKQQSNKELNDETQRILNALLERTHQLLAQYDTEFHAGVVQLMQEERIAGSQFRALLQKKKAV